jgi:hypothetical protein
MEQNTGEQKMFESPDLPDLAFLAYKGHPPRPSGRRGSLQFFAVDLPALAAEQLLASPEREAFAQIFEEWRRLRRMVDRMRDTEGARR